MKSSWNIKKMHPFLFSLEMGKDNVAVHKKCLQGKKMQFMVDKWVVCLVFGWFVGSLDGLWVVWMVCGWFRVL